MTIMPWFKCDPVAFNNGMMGLTLAERGAYITALNCIYANGAPVRDDAGYFSAMMGCQPREWLAIKKRLVAKGKLQIAIVDGAHCLTNGRAEREIAAWNTTVAVSRRAAQASLKARGIKPRNHLKLVDD